MAKVLQIEIEFFEQHRKKWFKYHAGKIAAIQGTTNYGFYNTYTEALTVMYNRFGVSAPFLLKEVRLIDIIERI